MNPGDTVTWWGQHATIVGIHEHPSAIVRFATGAQVTIALHLLKPTHT